MIQTIRWCCTAGKRERSEYKNTRGAGYLKKQNGVLHTLAELGQRGGTQPLEKIASSAALDAQSTATELGGNRDMRRDVPIGNLLAPQTKAREKKTRPAENTRRKKDNQSSLDLHVLHKRILQSNIF